MPTPAEYEARIAALEREIQRLDKYRELLVMALIKSIPLPHEN